MNRAKPHGVCMRAKTTRSTEHVPGPTVASSDAWMIYGCALCGVIFWVPKSPPALQLDGRCSGVTVVGKRCKLAATRGSIYCPHHTAAAEKKDLV